MQLPTLSFPCDDGTTHQWETIVISMTAVFFAGLIMLFGLWGVAQPQPLLNLVARVWSNPQGIYLAIAVRLAFGLALMLAATTSRYPAFISGLGLFVIVAGLSVPFFGEHRILMIVQWWKARPPWVIRLWALAAALLGALVLYALF